MALNRGFFSILFMLIAFVLFVILALVEGGVITWASGAWTLGGGLASMVLSFLCGGGWAAWNTRTVA
jgi:hypothetical protein